MATKRNTLVLTFLLIFFVFDHSAIGSVDTDGDGLNDMDETIFRTDIHNPDEDEDGMNDGEELTLGLFLNPMVFRPDREGVSQLYFASNRSAYYSRDLQPGNGQNGKAATDGFIPVDYFLLDNMTGADTSLLSISNTSVINSNAYISEWVKGYDSVNSFIIYESPSSFILPYDANDTLSIPGDDFQVPLITTEVSQSYSRATAAEGLSDAQNYTTPSVDLRLDAKELNTDFNMAMDGLTIHRRLDANWTLSMTFTDYNASLAGRFLLEMDPTIFSGTGIFFNGQAAAGTYGELLSGFVTDPNLGFVHMGYENLLAQIEIPDTGLNRLQVQEVDINGDGFTDSFQEIDSSMIHLLELEYRPNGDDSEIYRVTLRPAVNLIFATDNLVFSFSDQFRKMYYDTAQLGEFTTSTFGASYRSGGATTLRAPKFLNALLGTIDYPASQGDVAAQQAMEWFFNGTNQDGTPVMTCDINGYVTSLNLSGRYQATLSFSLPEQYLGLHENASVREVVGDQSNLSMEIQLSDGDNPFLDWLMGMTAEPTVFNRLVGVPEKGLISSKDENLLKNLFPFVRYDFLYDSNMSRKNNEIGAWNDISSIESQVAGATALDGRSISDILDTFGLTASVSASSSGPSQSDISDAYARITNNGLSGLSLSDILGGETTINFSDYFTEAELTELINKLEEYPGLVIESSVQQMLQDQFTAAFSLLPEDTSGGDPGSESTPPPANGGGGGGCSIGGPKGRKAEIDLGMLLVLLIPALIRTKLTFLPCKKVD